METFNQLMKSFKEIYQLDEEEVVNILMKALRIELGKNIIFSLNPEGIPTLFQINQGAFFPVAKKNIRSIKNRVQTIIQKRQKDREKLWLKRRFFCGYLCEGVFIDKTPNGYFIVVKGVKCFMPHSRSYPKEQHLYEIGNELTFEVVSHSGGKVILARKSKKIINDMLEKIIKIPFKLKTINNGYLVFISPPYLSSIETEILRSTIPCPLIIKKDRKHAI